jgi:hypothetical protein
MLREPIVLYSTNTWLAYIISERYYRGEHYVWCSPHFDPYSVPSLNYVLPPSSSPVEIYRGLRKDILSGDRHSAKIIANKAGILRGVESKRLGDIIDEDGAAEIASVVEASDIRDFRPMCYVIPFCLIRDRVRPVPIGQRAHPLSAEFVIEALPRDCFDAIGLEGI